MTGVTVGLFCMYILIIVYKTGYVKTILIIFLRCKLIFLMDLVVDLFFAEKWSFLSGWLHFIVAFKTMKWSCRQGRAVLQSTLTYQQICEQIENVRKASWSKEKREALFLFLSVCLFNCMLQLLAKEKEHHLKWISHMWNRLRGVCILSLACIQMVELSALFFLISYTKRGILPNKGTCSEVIGIASLTFCWKTVSDRRTVTPEIAKLKWLSLPCFPEITQVCLFVFWFIRPQNEQLKIVVNLEKTFFSCNL